MLVHLPADEAAEHRPERAGLQPVAERPDAEVEYVAAPVEALERPRDAPPQALDRIVVEVGQEALGDDHQAALRVELAGHGVE